MKKFNKSQVAKSLSVVLGIGAFALVQAPAVFAAQEQVEVIEVTGIRTSIIKAMDIKRSSSGVVDVISAEDIGKMPDTNLAESLQRITGVSIDRSNGEGQQVSVRGFGPSFNMVTLNGRQMPAAKSPKAESASSFEQSRAFNFAEIAAESVSGVEIYKTGKANVGTGGIGATINVDQARPFDFDGFKGAGSLKGTFDQSAERSANPVTPEISGMISNVWELSGDAEFGLLINGSYSERDNSEDVISSDGWIRGDIANGFGTNGTGVDFSKVSSANNPGGHYWHPRNLVVDIADHSRERTNGQVVLQFAPNSDLIFTVDHTISQFDDQVRRTQTATWFDNWQGATGKADENGTIYDIDVESIPGNSTGAFDANGYTDHVVTENAATGLNIAWQVTDTFRAALDVHSATSEGQPNGEISDFINIIAGPLGVDFRATYEGGVPKFSYDDSNTRAVDGSSIGSSYYDKTALRPNLGLERSYQVTNDIDQAQLDLQWVNGTENMSFIESVEFGVGKTDYEIDTQYNFRYFQFGTPQCGALCDFADPIATNHPEIFPFIAGHYADESLAVFSDFYNLADSNFNPVGDTGRIIQEKHIIKEETTSAYLQVSIESEISGMLFSALIGARYEQTDVVGTSVQDVPKTMQWLSTTELRAVPSGENSEFSLNGEYSNFLPSVDLSLEITDDVVARVSYGVTLAKPSLNAMRPSVSLSNARPGGPYNASQGNPDLEPYESSNIDLSLEWYYNEGSYASIAYFNKTVENYIEQSTTQGTIVGSQGWQLTDPNPSNDPLFTVGTEGVESDQVITWDITSSRNAEDANVDGFEIALQHIFGESGFGLQANATFVDGDVEYDSRAVAQTVNLVGLSDSANFVAFYEKDAFQLRIAYNWRDEFLLAMGQLRQTEEPTFVKSYGQWDLSASYDINENFSVFLEGINITGQDTEHHGRFDNHFLYKSFQDPRFSLGVRASF